MEGSVEECDFEVLNGVAGEDAVFHCVLEAFFYGGDEFFGDVAALDFVDELEPGLAFVDGFDAYDDVGEFAASTGLLFEDFAVFDGAFDGFAVGDLGLALVALDFELAAEAVEDDVEVELAHAFDDGLSGLFVGVEAECRVFLCEFE